MCLSVLVLFILKTKSMSINLSAAEGEAIVLEDSCHPNCVHASIVKNMIV